MEPMVFNVPEYNMPKLKKLLDRLNKKAKKAGTGELKLHIVGQSANKTSDGYVDIVKHILVEGAPPKIGGWTFVARLDHNTDPTGASNLIYVMPGQSLKAELRNSPAQCEHCNWLRKRRDTYILREDATGDLKQVGRTCVQDFIGIDPERVLAHAERIRQLTDAASKAESEALDPKDMNNYRNIDLLEFLTWVSYSIRFHGWTSGKQAHENGWTSTRNRAHVLMFPTGIGHRDAFEDEDEQMATAAIVWAKGLDKSKDDFTHNLVTIAETGYVDFKASGTAAYIVRGYQRHLERQKPSEDLSSSDWFAKLGDRITTPVTILTKKDLDRPYDQFPTTLYRMLTPEGNLVVTFNTGRFNPNVGDTVNIRGTVSKLDTFNNVKQTIVKRVQAAS